MHVDALAIPRIRRLGRRQLLMWAGIAAPVVFTLLMLMAGQRYSGYQHRTQAISELAAVNSPSPGLQTLNFYVTGVLTLAFAAGLDHLRQRRLGALLFGSFGAMMVAHGALPCDAGCQFTTPVGSAHNALGVIGFIAAIAGIWLHSRQSSDAAYRAWSAVGALAALAGFVLWIVLAKVMLIASLNGTLQRAFVAVLLGWMFATALRELRKSHEVRS